MISQSTKQICFQCVLLGLPILSQIVVFIWKGPITVQEMCIILFVYIAPEILNKEAITEAADMWGLGALTYVMLVLCSSCFFLLVSACTAWVGFHHSLGRIPRSQDFISKKCVMILMQHLIRCRKMLRISFAHYSNFLHGKSPILISTSHIVDMATQYRDRLTAKACQEHPWIKVKS